MVTMILQALLYFIQCCLFWIQAALGKLIDVLYEAFEIFVGASTVRYNGKSSYLLDIFLNNSLINTLFWGMAVIGIVMTFGFAVAAVVKKMFDSSGEKMKQSYGVIVMDILKAILLIVLLTAIVSATVTATGVLMEQIEYVFSNVEEIDSPSTIVFTDAQYATMFRIIDTIGNYCLSPTYDTRFNINSCFNAVRANMQSLEKAGVFDYTYSLAPDSWQYDLKQLYLAADISQDLPLDEYNEQVEAAIKTIVWDIKNNSSFAPIQKYEREYSLKGVTANLGKIPMIAASYSAAENEYYNTNADMNDSIRRPFYIGDKDIYDISEVESVFDLNFGSWNHLLALGVQILLLLELAKMCVNAVARIFNIILLYLMAPFFASVMPLDNGGKMKQWTTAFIIQSLSIFGAFVSMRLMLIFIPIVMSSKLVFFSGSFANIVTKMLFMMGIVATASKASSMISGILADNAGMQSIMAGDVGSGFVNQAMQVGGAALSVAGAVGSGLATVTGVGTLIDKGKDLFKNMRQNGGLIGSIANSAKGGGGGGEGGASPQGGAIPGSKEGAQGARTVQGAPEQKGPESSKNNGASNKNNNKNNGKNNEKKEEKPDNKKNEKNNNSIKNNNKNNQKGGEPEGIEMVDLNSDGKVKGGGDNSNPQNNNQQGGEGNNQAPDGNNGGVQNPENAPNNNSKQGGEGNNQPADGNGGGQNPEGAPNNNGQQGGEGNNQAPDGNNGGAKNSESAPNNGSQPGGGNNQPEGGNNNGRKSGEGSGDNKSENKQESQEKPKEKAKNPPPKRQKGPFQKVAPEDDPLA